MQYVSPKYSEIILVIISSICFAFIPSSAKIALDERASLSFLLASRYSIGVGLLLLIMFLRKTKLAISNDIVPRIIKPNVLALGLVWAKDDDYEDGVCANLYGLIVSFVGLICFVLFIISASDVADTIGSTLLNFYICLTGPSVVLAVILLHFGITMRFPMTHNGIFAIISNGFFSF